MNSSPTLVRTTICTIGTVGRVVLDDHGRLDARRQDAQDGAVDRVDLGDRGTDVGARMEIDLDQADAGNAVGLDALDAVGPWWSRRAR